MSKRRGRAPAGAVSVLTRAERISLEKCLLATAAKLLEAAFHQREREEALAKIWAGTQQAEADVLKLLGASEPRDFRRAATAGTVMTDPDAAVAVIGEAEAILGIEAAKIIREADGP